MTISEIREILKKDDVPEEVLKEILSDERKGVRDLAASYMRRLERESRERRSSWRRHRRSGPLG